LNVPQAAEPGACDQPPTRHLPVPPTIRHSDELPCGAGLLIHRISSGGRPGFGCPPAWLRNFPASFNGFCVAMTFRCFVPTRQCSTARTRPRRGYHQGSVSSRGPVCRIHQRVSVAVYAYGLRRRELVMLDLTDFGLVPHVPGYGNYGALSVRWAKGTKGSGPRRRTVPTSPEFAWAVQLLQYWCGEGRQLFSTADRSPALWPSERGGRLTLRALGRSFTAFHQQAGLPPGAKTRRSR
jgi:hypothetical protein